MSLSLLLRAKRVVGLAVTALVLLVSSSAFAAQTDGGVYPPPATGSFAYNSFVLPLTQGTSYVDPVFGERVRRLTTDRAHGRDHVLGSLADLLESLDFELARALSALERILLRLAVFVVFVYGLRTFLSGHRRCNSRHGAELARVPVRQHLKIVVSRDSQLYTRLERAFANIAGVEVILDRRHGERQLRAALIVWIAE